MTATTGDTTVHITDDTTGAGPWVSGIGVMMLPVADLARSASFYGALLGLEVRREFVGDGQVSGVALGRGDIGWGLNLRLRSTLAAPADLRGEHPVVWRVEDLDALDAFRDHAAGLGLDPVWFEHDDAVLVRVVDPDDIDVFVAVSKRPWTSFQGYTHSSRTATTPHTPVPSPAPRVVPGTDRPRTVPRADGRWRRADRDLHRTQHRPQQHWCHFRIPRTTRDGRRRSSRPPS